MTSSKKYKSLPPDIVGLRLEAIFHPKFENETPDSEIRRKMLEGVASGDGYVEASLKHSGSLLLWSGRQCYYSKNSTNNAFSKVGEVMLMRHFARCYGGGGGDGGGRRDWRDEYERCGELVYRSRLTCSFEVVTSVLGHHGDLPNRDYLVLIAVADRGGGGRGGGGAAGGFYSTSELVRFAQAHRYRTTTYGYSRRARPAGRCSAPDELRDTGGGGGGGSIGSDRLGMRGGGGDDARKFRRFTRTESFRVTSSRGLSFVTSRTGQPPPRATMSSAAG
ncbi:hypothetical protein ACHAW5_007070 [Stephanodiscus triporus]|uniref:Uncharacterized protein n=1 Tax=Stephanodiscus triporus TaxID=2934178 RepID=A0ABD3Q1I8_9STRA